MAQLLSDLSSRLIILQDSLKQTVQLIQRLSTFHISEDGTATDTSDNTANPENDTEADIASDIHDALNQAEQDLELLKLDIEDFVLPNAHKRGPRREGERDREGGNLLARSSRLTEDIALARTRFRKAQLQAKRNADRARERERGDYLASLQAAANAVQPDATEADAKEHQLSNAEMRTSLFARRGHAHKSGQPNATKDDMILTASSDLTTSLRRTHALLSNEVSRSRFAHDTLASSNAALEELNTRYTTLDDLLARSRGLLGTLLTSQKSDTWYLQTAIYMLVATIGWLLFRRLLYGPMWWLVWFPVRTFFRTTGWAVGGAVGGAVRLVGKRSVYESSSMPITAVYASTVATSVTSAVTPSTGSKQHVPEHTQAINDDAVMSDIVARMVEASQVMVGGTQTAGESEVSHSIAYTDRQPAATDDFDPPMPTAGEVAGQEASRGAGQGAGQGEGHGAGQGEGQVAGQGSNPVQAIRRGDGQVLPERDPATQPRNPKKRMFEDPPPPPAAQQQQQPQREL